MQSFSVWPERWMRMARWTLLGGWILLILSLFWPGLGVNGNSVFWNSVVPGALLIIAAISHELWRRICPLAFVSQLARFLDLQRRRPGKRGKPEIVKIQADSWLGQHHIELQWSLLISGICLRLLAVNNNALALATLSIVTLIAALIVGWAFGGKAWCQYICPMGPVQQVVTGARSPLGSTAHVQNKSRITQSMCRTISSDGHEQSACVACQANCMDIDAERSFWQNLQGKRGLDWAWSSYLGLVLAFFLLMRLDGSGNPGNAFAPLTAALPIPRIIAFPALMTAAAFVSVQVTHLVESALNKRYQHLGVSDARQRARQHTRQLTTFLAVNTFFSFVAPLQGRLGAFSDDLMRSIVFGFTTIGLIRGWNRTQATYRRESTSDNLRKQLGDLPGLDKALDGRSLDALSPEEVFTLVKALPAIGQQKGRQIYGDVMTEMLKSGRLNYATAMLELQELRQSLGLSAEEHHNVVGLLAEKEPNLIHTDSFERQIEDLRLDAAQERIEELMRINRLDVLVPSELTTVVQDQLEQLRQTSGLDEETWLMCLQRFGPESEREHHRLEGLSQSWMKTAELAAVLAQQAENEPLLNPLARILEQRQQALLDEIAPARAKAGMPPLPEEVAASGTREQAFDLLWRDSCPDTAGWVVMLDRILARDGSPRPERGDRSPLGSSNFLRAQQNGEPDDEQIRTFRALLRSSLFDDMRPAGMVWLGKQGSLKRYEPGEIVMNKGDRSDHLAVVMQENVIVNMPTGEQLSMGHGEVIGELGVIIGAARTATVEAGDRGAVLFNVPEAVLDELLSRSHDFNRGLLRELANRVAAV